MMRLPTENPRACDTRMSDTSSQRADHKRSGSREDDPIGLPNEAARASALIHWARNLTPISSPLNVSAIIGQVTVVGRPGVRTNEEPPITVIVSDC